MAGSIAGLEADLLTRLVAVLPFRGRVLWRDDPALLSPLDVRITRSGADLVVHAKDAPRDGDAMQITILRAPAALAWMQAAGPDVGEMTFSLADGQLPSMARCAFSSCVPDKHLVPDFYFFRDRGYRDLRDWLRDNDVPWAERSADIVWRGRLKGVGLFSLDPAHMDNPLVRQRLRLAMRARGTRLDFRFVSALTPMEEAHLRAGGLMADRVPARSWTGRKFAVDVDGFSNSWDNLMHRMLQGCCVLKIDSQMGFRQWYYDRIRPWEHYVPIRRDLSDLEETLDWCLSHDADCAGIAAAGRDVARRLDWDSVLAETGEGLRRISTPPPRWPSLWRR